MKKLPYGIANFLTIRRENYFYVDRTAYIRKLESMGPRSLLFVRPRRFGKSLWLNVLRRYYDLALKDEFDDLFGDLDIGKNPTPLKNSYFVLGWNFSRVDPRGTADDIARRMNDSFNNMIKNFLVDYTGYLTGDIEIANQAIDTLGNVLAEINQCGGRLYLLIDEYDNFANEVMTSNEDIYRDLVQKEGALKTLFKGLKELSESKVLDRMFVTGVSPVVMSDITSGANIFTNIFLKDEFNALCGFTDEEVFGILKEIGSACNFSEQEVQNAHQMMRQWYNGSKFSPESDTYVYNPTLTLYFLHDLVMSCKYPRQMLDSNLAADEGWNISAASPPAGRQ